MVASFLQLDHGGAVVALLPSTLLRHFDELLQCWVSGTVSRRVCLVVTDRTDSRATSLAFSHLAAMFKADVIRLDPLTTLRGRAVESVLGVVLQELAIPSLLEALVEQLIDVLEIDVVLCAAPRRHMCRIGDRHPEDAL